MLQKIKGFTLVELFISIMILGILLAIMIPRFIDFKNKVNENKTQIEQPVKSINGNQRTDKLPSLNIK